MLPVRQLPAGEFTFPDGVKLGIRGLSRAEAIQLRGFGDDAAGVEIFCISCATGANEDATREWMKTTPQGEIEDLVNAIAALSGLNDEAGKDDAGGLQSAKSTE